MNNYLIHIPLEVVNSIIPSLISEKNRVLEVYCPEKEELAHLNRDSFVSIIEAASTADLTAYEDTASDIPLMSELPVPGKIVKTKKGKFDSEILTLSNGIKVIVKPTEYKADEISFEAFSSGGSSLYDDSEILQLNFLNEVVRLGGIGEFNTIELKKCLAGKNAGASTSINTYSQTINGFASPKDLETMLQLTYLSITAPRKDVNAFENYKNRLKVSLEARAKLPAKALNDSVSVALYGHHPRNMSITADMIDQIDYDRILEMHKERFANTGNLTFVFVGNIDMETAKPLFEQYLGSLPSNKKKEKIVDRKMYLRKGEYRNVFSKEQETPKASVSIVMHGKTKYTPENRLTMSMLSQVLDMVYMEEIREKEGGTYGVSVRGSVSKLPVEQSVLRISFDTNPESHDKLSRIALAEFDILIKEGPQEEHLVKIKEYMYK